MAPENLNNINHENGLAYMYDRDQAIITWNNADLLLIINRDNFLSEFHQNTDIYLKKSNVSHII